MTIILTTLPLLLLLYVLYAGLLYVERRLWGHWPALPQRRLWPLIGPGRALFKPTLLPAQARLWACYLAPAWTLVFSVGALALWIPWGRDGVALDLLAFILLLWTALPGGLLYAWGTRNAMLWQASRRLAGQALAYSVPTLIALAGPTLLVGQLDLGAFVRFQGNGVPLIVYQPLSLCLVALGLLVVGERLPWRPTGAPSVPEDFQTQHVGGIMALFHWAGYVTILLVSVLIATIYLAGPLGPGGSSPYWLLPKAMVVALALLWVRDRWLWRRAAELSQRLWIWLTVLALGNTLLTALLLVVS